MKVDGSTVATVDFLNVGFGECTIIHLEGEVSKTIIIDAGDSMESIYVKDPSRISLKEYIKTNGIEVIDLLIITHPHPDHISGVTPIIDVVEIKEVWLHLLAPYQENQHSLEMLLGPLGRGLFSLGYLLEAFKQRNIPYEVIDNIRKLKYHNFDLIAFPPHIDQFINIQTQLDLLYKLEDETLVKNIASQIDRSLNETSLTVKIKINDCIILLTSDVKVERVEIMLESHETLSILQAPHHGDVNHLSDDFLKRYHPETIIVSAAYEGTYSLPSSNFDSFVKEHHPEGIIFYTGYKKDSGKKHRGLRVNLFKNSKFEVVDIE
ncbi:ComEC/Rec2 family competence protein [Metabacillus sp. HB246100]